jgi:hypothetical protein
VDRGLIVHLRRSKTDQEGIGRKVGIPFARVKVCPVQAVKDWLAVSGLTEGPLFRPISGARFAARDIRHEPARLPA